MSTASNQTWPYWHPRGCGKPCYTRSAAEAERRLLRQTSAGRNHEVNVFLCGRCSLSGNKHAWHVDYWNSRLGKHKGWKPEAVLGPLGL